ncbi:MAG: Ran-binding zinc finger domain-containing protein [Isosphaeraceae bacterium]
MSTPAGWKQGPGKDWACPVCLAQNHPSAPRCWQCQSERKTEPDPLADPLLDPVAPAPARPRISNQAVVGVYLVLVAASVVVIEWFARQSSDMGKIAAIVLDRALLSTAWKRHASAAGQGRRSRSRSRSSSR